MAKKVGELIKEARTAAKLTQAQLAEQVTGLTAADISKAERGEKELAQTQLKQIAKATGVTQTSLLSAAGGSAAKAGASAKAGGKAKKTASAAKKTGSGKTGSVKSSMQLTAAEKKLVELYRKADAEKKKEVMKLLKGTSEEAGELLTSLLTNAMSMFGKRGMPGEGGAANERALDGTVAETPEAPEAPAAEPGPGVPEGGLKLVE